MARSITSCGVISAGSVPRAEPRAALEAAEASAGGVAAGALMSLASMGCGARRFTGQPRTAPRGLARPRRGGGAALDTARAGLL